MNLVNSLLRKDSSITADLWTRIGGKAKGLVWLYKNSVRVPDFWVIEGYVLQQFIDSLRNKNETISQFCNKDTNKKIVTQWIANQITNLPAGHFAVRSSGILEDSDLHSFAGIYESFLNVSEKYNIAEKILHVYLSGYSSRAKEYFEMKKICAEPTGTSVVVQLMVNAKMSGVCFSQNIQTGNVNECWVSSTYGLGEDLVSGNVEGIEMTIDSEGVAKFESQKKLKTESDKEIIQEIATLTKHLAILYKKPVDLEWAYDGKSIWILQVRPITTVSANLKQQKLVFDNSNIQESYCGVTTPLTFSYANEAYLKVYTKLLKFLNISQSDLDRQSSNLDSMLGFISGRVYYNINSWYAALTLLPGFSKRKTEMESMMGLEEPVDFVEDQKIAVGFERIKKILKTTRLVLKLVLLNFRIDKIVDEFDRWFLGLYNEARAVNLENISSHELIGLIKHYQTSFLEKWHIPVLNDTLVMMNMGRLQKILKKHDSSECVKAIVYGNEIESILPTKRLSEMSTYIHQTTDLKNVILNSSSKDLPDIISTFFPELQLLVGEFIEKYGDRTMGELKLETITFRQDASLFYDLLKNFVGSKMKFDSIMPQSHVQEFESVKQKMNFLEKRYFEKLIKSTSRTVAHREKMRMHRTRNYGLMRDFYLSLGKKWTHLGVLKQERDIFYLSINEIFDINYGKNLTRSYINLVQLRRAEALEFKNEKPKNQCHIEYPAGQGLSGQVITSYSSNERTESGWNGLGCSQGVVEGEIVLVENPNDIKNIHGKILLAMRTDPGWTPLFALIKGVIIERGSLLSHSAVISREMGIPAVVNIKEITQILKSGDRVRINGTTGQISRI